MRCYSPIRRPHEVGYNRDDVLPVVDASAAPFGITHGDIITDDLSYIHDTTVSPVPFGVRGAIAVDITT
jgi:hypothetical protein